MTPNEGQEALDQRELKCGDLVKYRLYDNQVYSTNAIFLRRYYDTRRIGEEEFEEPVEMHEIYLFDTATCENVFGFELEGVLNE